MAIVRTRTDLVQKVTVEKEVIEYNLVLSPEEARFLMDVLALVAGNPDHTRRRYQVEIAEAFRAVGLDASDETSTYLSGSIVCHDSR